MNKINKKSFKNKQAIACKHLNNVNGIILYDLNQDYVIYERYDDLKIRKAKLYYDYKRDSYYFYDCFRWKHYIDEFMRCRY